MSNSLYEWELEHNKSLFIEISRIAILAGGVATISLILLNPPSIYTFTPLFILFISLTVLSLFLIKKGKNFEAICKFWLFSGQINLWLSIFITGGIHSEALPFLFVYPVLGNYLLNSKWTFVNISLNVPYFILLLILDNKNILSQYEPSMVLYSWNSLGAMFCITWIITRSEKKKKQLMTKHEKIEMLLEETNRLADIGGWQLEIQSGELWWSKQTYRIHELPINSQVNLENAINYYTPECRHVVQAAVENAIKNKTGWNLELPFITEKNNRIWVNAIGKYKIDKDGKEKLMGTFQNITEKKRLN